MDCAGLLDRAAGVLDGNWIGAMTRPGPHLYPHQWSWDAAFVAIGNARRRPDRARQELRSLFAGQWRNGMLPHIVFAGDEEGSKYFPGADVWQAWRSPNAPRRPRTSGVVQPPVHATAAWRLHQAAPDEAFLRELYPRLCAWHEYLHRDRDSHATGLVAIRHPWESGQDNSPAWDQPLEQVPRRERSVGAASRSDLGVAPAEERPTLAAYDEYVSLVEILRDVRYDEALADERCPFRVADPCFNALLVAAERDLAEVAHVLGDDPQPARARAARTAAAIEQRLWDEQRGLYVAEDLRSGQRVDAAVAGGLVPLFAGVPARGRAQEMLATLIGPGFWPQATVGHPVPSLDRRDGRFEPRRYWRGPAWVNINWLLRSGLRRYGFDKQAARLKAATLALVEEGGMREYFDPDTGEGYGSEAFSWTAALVIDLLSDARPAS